MDYTDADFAALAEGRTPDDFVSGVQVFVTRLRSETAGTPPIVPGLALSEFIGVSDVAPIVASGPIESHRRKKMFAGVSAMVGTLTGKVLLGTAVAAAAVGGAQAADVVDIPGLPDPARPADVVEVALVDDSAPIEAPGAEDGTAGEEAADDADDPAVDADDPAGEANDHGQAVSDFAHETELEGCEKGQAISDLASEKADDHRQNPEKDHDPCDKDDPEADQIVDEPVDEDDGADEPDEGEDDEGEGNAFGKDKERPNENSGNGFGHDKAGDDGNADDEAADDKGDGNDTEEEVEEEHADGDDLGGASRGRGRSGR